MRTFTQKVAFALIALMCFAMPQAVMAQDCLVIGEGTAHSSWYLPVANYYHNCYSQQLFLAEELEMGAAQITSVSFQYDNATEAMTRTISVYMANTDAENLSTAFVTDGLQEVLSATLFTFDPNDDWSTIELTTPFAYDGTSNLVVAVYMNYSSAETSYSGGYRFAQTAMTGMARYASNDTSSPDQIALVNFAPTATGTSVSYRCNTQFCYTTSGGGSSCAQPTALSITEVGARYVSLSWEGGSGTYDVGYKAPGEDGYTYYERNTTATEYTFTDLQPNTNYSFAVKSKCGDEESNPKTKSAKTAIAIPYEVNFDALSSFPSELKRYSGLFVDSTLTATRTSTTSGWSFISSTSGVFESKHMYCSVSYTYKYWAELPSIHMEDNAVLTFMMALTGSSSSYTEASTSGSDDRFIVLASVDEGATWAVLRKWDNAGSEDVFNNIPRYGDEFSIDLSAYAGQNVLIAFYTESTASNATNYIHIDDVVIDFGRSCSKPTGLHEVAGRATTSSVQLAWDDAAAAAWSVQYKKSGESEWNTVAADSNPFTLDGLDTYTDYDVRVAALCDATDPTSLTRYCKEISVKTAAGVPYHESFNHSSVPADWKRYEGLYSSVIDGGDMTAVSLGWSEGAKNNIFPDSTYHLYLNIFGEERNHWIVSPSIEMQAGYELSFDLALTKSEGGAVTAGGQEDDMFAVLVYADDEWNIAAQWTNTGAGYVYDDINATAGGQTVKIDLSSYAGKNVQIAFYGESTVANGDNNLHISNLSIDLIPACASALSLSFDDIDITTATALWTAQEEGGNWAYGYIANPAANFAPTDADYMDTIALQSFALTELTGNTQYAFFVRHICDDAASDPIVRTFKTFPSPKTMPWTETFNAAGFPEFWDNAEGTTTSASQRWNKYKVAEGDSCMRFNSYSNSNGNTNILATPRIDLSEAAILTFDWKNPTGGAGEVLISTDNGTTRTSLKNTGLTGVTDWTPFEINLTPYTGQKVILYFKGTSNYGSGDAYLYLDNVKVQAAPDCLKPTGLEINEIAAESAAALWNDDNDGATWVYACLPDTVDEPAGEDMTPITTNTLQLTDLTEKTNYIFYLRKQCGETFSESISEAFKTEANPFALPFVENFNELTSGIPEAWSNEEGTMTTASYRWNYYATGYDGAGLRMNSYNASNGLYSVLATPRIILSEPAMLSFMWKNPTGGAGEVLIAGKDGQRISLMSNLTGYSDWQSVELNLSDYTFDTVIIYFKGTSNWGNGDAYLYLDDVKIEALPSCMKPTALVAVNSLITTSSAALDWTAGLNENHWFIRYKKVADEEWTLVADSVLAHPFTLTGLESSTAYEAQVAAWCDINDSTAISDFTNSAIFTTLCDAWSIAEKGVYTEGFEAYEGKSYSAQDGVLPACWDAVADGTVYPHVIGTGSYLYVHEGSNALTFYGSGNCYAAMPEFVDSLNTLRISFWAAWENVSNGTLTLGYITADDQETFHSIASFQGATGHVMEKFVVDLDALPAEAARLVFRWYHSTQYSCCIDDIEVMPIPSCLEPTGLAAVEENATLNSIQLAWTPQGSETNWLIQYKKAAESDWTYVADSVNVNPFTVTGLDASNTYNFRIAAWCNTADSASASPFSNAISAVTACGIVDAFPFAENFDAMTGVTSGNALPLCWSHINTCTSSTYNYYPTVYAGSSYAASGNNSMKFYSYYSSSIVPQDQIAILPQMENINTLRMNFNARKYLASTSYSTYYSDFVVGVMSDPEDASTFVPVKSFDPASTEYEACEVRFNTYTGEGQYIAIKLPAATSSQTSRGIYIDDVLVRPLPNCLEPEGLALSDITTDGVKATWTNEEGAAWIYAVTLASEEEPAIDQYIAAQSNSVVISGLAEDNTDYIFYLRKNCGEDNVSDAVSALFHTKMLPAAVPYTDNFEDGNNWMFINGGLTNAWTYGEATHNGAGTHALYISNDNGVSNAYTTSSAVVVYAVKTFNFEEGIYTFQYDWKANGETTYDYLRVALVPDSIELTASTSLPTGLSTTAFPAAWNAIALDGASKLNLVTAWQTQICRELAVPAGTYKVVFLWRDDTSGGTQEPAAIDNFSISKLACVPVKALSVKDITASSATIEWTNGAADQDAWQLVYTADPAFDIANVTEEEIIAVASNPYALSELATDTLYTVYVRANCGDEDGFSRWTSVSFRTASLCQMPSDIAADDITINSASISWNTYGQTGFNLRYGTDGTNWTVVNNVEMPYTLTGLNASTAYMVQVQAACAADDENSWSSTFAFKTAYAMPFDEKFGASPADWTQAKGLLSDILAGEEFTTGTVWYFGSSNGVFDNHARINIYGTDRKHWLMTPNVFVQGDAQLTFDLALTAYSGTTAAPATTGTDDKFIVLVSTDNGETWTILREWSNAEGAEYVYNNIAHTAEGEPVVINLSAYDGQNVMIAFYGESTVTNADNNLHIDNVSIDLVPTCLKPTNFAVADIKAHSAKLSWTAGEEGQNAWQIAYDTLPSNKPDTLTIIDVQENPYVLSGLDPETRYYVYVRANCGEQDGVSRWTDGKTFLTTIACPAPSGLAAQITPGEGSIATLTWNAGEAQAWQVEYSLNSDMTDSLVLNVIEPVANLTGLTAEATYYARVKADCGEIDGESLYSAIISFIPTNKYELTLNDGTSTNSFVPIEGSYVDEGTRSQFIIPEEDLANIEWDSITSLTFYGVFTSSSRTNWDGAEWAVYMMEAPEASMSALVDWTTMTQVKAAGSLALVEDQMVITLDEPYQYQGGHLMIGIYQTTNGNWAGVNWYGVSATGASFGGHASSVSQRNFLPKMKLTYVPGVAPACPNPKKLAISDITDNSALASWKAVEGATWEYAIAEGNAEPAEFSQTEDNFAALTGLRQSTEYTFYLRRACGEDVYSDEIHVSFTTVEHVASIPFNEYFEGENYWKSVADNQANAWMIGNATAQTGENALYVSNNGADYAYDNEATTASFATILINFDLTGDYTIKYYWKAEGDYGDDLYDYMRVVLVPAEAAIIAGNAQLPESAIALDNGGLYGQSDWKYEQKLFNVTAGDYKLVVAWFNDEADGDLPGAIDNISIVSGDAITNIESGAGFENKAIKFIKNDQVYILLNGKVYTITGQRVEMK